MAIEKSENDEFATAMRQWQRGWDFTDNDVAAIKDVMMGKGYSDEQAQYVIDRASNSSFYDHNTNASEINDRWAAIQYEFEQAGVPELGEAVKAEAETRATTSSTWQFSDKQKEQIEDIFDDYGYTTKHSDAAMEHAQNSSFSDYDDDENKWDDLESQIDAATQISAEDKESMKADIEALKQEEKEPVVWLPPPTTAQPSNGSPSERPGVHERVQSSLANPAVTSETGTIYDENSPFVATISANKDLNFNQEEIEKLIAVLKKLPLSDVQSAASNVGNKYDTNVNKDTKTKMSSIISDGTFLQNEVDNSLETWQDYITNLINNLTGISEQISAANGNDPTLEDQGDAGLGGTGGASSGYGGSSSSSGGGSTSTFPGLTGGQASDGFVGDDTTSQDDQTAGDTQEIPDNDNNTLTYIESAVVGTLTFTAIVSLFEDLDSPSNIQSSLTSEYEVVGIIEKDGKYYYRIYDKDLQKFYYAEIDENSVFTTEYTELLKTTEETMMLESPEIGGDVLSKMTDPNNLYFVKGSLENQGITLEKVVDGMDGKDYYVPMSDTVELVGLETITTPSTQDVSSVDDNTTNDVVENVG